MSSFQCLNSRMLFECQVLLHQDISHIELLLHVSLCGVVHKHQGTCNRREGGDKLHCCFSSLDHSDLVLLTISMTNEITCAMIGRSYDPWAGVVRHVSCRPDTTSYPLEIDLSCHTMWPWHRLILFFQTYESCKWNLPLEFLGGNMLNSHKPKLANLSWAKHRGL